MVTGKKYAIDFKMSDGSVKTVEFEVPLAELVGAIMRDGSTPMEGNLPMGGYKVTGMAEPTENTDAATKGYADKKVPLDGSAAMTGDLTMGGHRVKDVAAPEENGDAVNRGYADEHYRSNTWMPNAKQIGKMEKTLKWTNASPNSTFSAQTVSMDLNGYDAVIVEGRFNADSFYDPFKMQSVMCPIGHSAPLLVSYDNTDSGGLASRVFTAYTTGPAFRYGHNAVAKTSNDAMAVPTRIYGVKFFT